MLEKVYSGLPYFYNWDETRQGIISCYVRFKEPVNRTLWEEAVNEALEIHEHFKVRLAIENNNVYYQYNENKARVYEGLDEDFTLIRDTEGYLFAFRVVQDRVYLDLFHLLSDGDGVMELCKTVALLYFRKVYKAEADWDAFIEKRVKSYTGDRQKIDPYTVDKVVHREKKSDNRSISEFFQLYEEGDTERCIDIKWDYEEYRQKSPVGLFSPYAVINVLLGNTIEEHCHSNEQIAAYMPIDMRKRVGVKNSMFNCLSYTNVKHITGTSGMSLYEQCREYTNSLKLYYGVDNSLDIMSEDAKFIEIMQNEKLSVARKCGIVRGITRKTQSMRGTFGMSYVQFCKEEEVYRRYVSEMVVCPPNSNIGIVCELVLLGNEVNLCIRYGDRQKEIISKLIQKIKDLNIDICVQDVVVSNTKIAIDLLK